MIEKLPDELYQLEKKNKQKVLNFMVTENNSWGWEILQNFCQVFERQNRQNQTIYWW